MKIQLKVINFGDSIGIIFPKVIKESLDIEAGDLIDISNIVVIKEKK